MNVALCTFFCAQRHIHTQSRRAPVPRAGAATPAPAPGPRYWLVSGQGAGDAAGRPGAGRQVWRRGRAGLATRRPNRPIAAASLALLLSISYCSRADLGRSTW